MVNESEKNIDYILQLLVYLLEGVRIIGLLKSIKVNYDEFVFSKVSNWLIISVVNQ